ncbi:histone-lysine N-methyltransferase SETMAR [Trichonephila clavipes]|nr:histone-lysine N-methyltransferase SETMAR [Trichonephila clavipes]
MLNSSLTSIENLRNNFANIKEEAIGLAKKWSNTPEFEKKRHRKVRQFFDDFNADEKLQDRERLFEVVVFKNCIELKVKLIPGFINEEFGFGWDEFGHPSYSPDLTPSDFHPFLHLKSFLAGKHFNNDKELKENVSNWLKTQAATFYEEGIEKLVPRYDTCLQSFGSYVER